MKDIIDISFQGILIIYGLVFLNLILVELLKFKLLKNFLIAIVRMSLQLFLAGLILKFIFKLNTASLIFTIFFIMAFFASHIILNKAKIPSRKIFPYIFISITLVTLIIGFLFIKIIIGLTPWYEARYFIPLMGMILGNSMNGCALAIERFYSGVKEKKKVVETYLCHGATTFEATKNFIIQSLKAATLPYITSMSGIGLVFLPGMMTGQILSGTNPIIAVKYQLSIMIIIFTSVVFSSLLVVFFSYKLFFDKFGRIRVYE
ncbi:iron export ABC transporter permease subunit FetB [Deferribacter autotrophicus]|uniref:Iron export ABC transporter permease subunit FetB n=1 Tax=Deferribacter autotrophicus TaxID=500465 RepID=A0A5A8F5X3_9BACT|nr:iron export ABC transporter permease subunit FetB [Deferribacter autotrophicus]KAA0259100.1 iron export ABC transporter permease subunit FetB [Deferribacter autotrophicus]